MKSIAIMQPTFLPWIGYFSLIDRVDEYVFLDHVQFDKRSWQQRNRIKTPQGSMWLSASVITKGRSDQALKDVELLYEGNKNPFDKIKNSIDHNYKKSKYYNEYAADLYAFFDEKPQYISDLNQNIIKWACNILDIQTPFIKSSELFVEGDKDILLANICKDRGATHYISPPGSKAYLDDSDTFETAKIHLSYHDYNHPTYTQLCGDFEPYMCILDLLFNEGSNSANIIKTGLS
ncbi:MAG: WbqC family protein [Alphaproteobacteria bacterium]